MSMKIAEWLTERLVGSCLVLMLAAPTAKAAVMPWQDAAPARQEQSTPSSGVEEAGSDSESGKQIVNPSQSEATLPDAPEVAQSTSTGSNGSNGSTQPSQDQQRNDAAQPVGTAAAPAVKSTGVAGSRVSGAAIAPAKQRRVHTFLISAAVIAAACVAVGTVVALTHATPSQPR
jgi:cobalamin biosynthesis Mg chelatase CobN